MLSYYIMCFLDLDLQFTYMYLNWFYFITTKPATYLTWSRTRNPWRAKRALYQLTQRGWADSFGAHDNYKGESTDLVISLL